MRHKLTISDKILEKIFLPIIPRIITPNMITWARLISIPFVAYFFWIENYGAALPLFAISAFSDAVDGALARTRNMVTDFGKLFDPLADKLLVVTTGAIIIPRFLDLELALAIIGIEAVLIISAYVKKRYYGTIIQAENAGKIKMILQSLGIGTLLFYALSGIPLFLILAHLFLYGAIFFALISLVVYRAI